MYLCTITTDTHSTYALLPQIDELKNKSCQSELEYQAKMADCEAQLLQLSSSLTRINTKYAELRQKRYSRGERGNPPKRHIKAALEHGRETKVTSTTQPKCDSSSHQQDRVTSRRCTEEQRTVQDKASTRTLRLNHLGASGAPQSTVQAARKGSHVTTGSRKASKRSPTVREKQVLVHTAQRKETRGTRDVGTACVHDMDKTSDAERDKEDCANRRGWQEVGKGEEEAGVVRTEERRRECRTKPSSSELVDKLIEEHMKLLNQDLLQVIKSGN